MKPHFFLLIFSIFFLLVNSYHYRNLSYQAHGFNDLDYFLQQLVKGSSFFKIDVSLASVTSCSMYSTWEKNNKCEYLDYFDVCCLGLRGDTGSAPIFNEAFNTTDDFLKVLNNSKYDFIWRKEVQRVEYKGIKYIAINFQYNHPLSKMTERFLHDLITIIDNRGLNIQIITGSDDFITSYEKKCLENCNYMERTIAESNIMFQSSDFKQGSNRTRNFNVNFMELSNFCEIGFPEWPDRYGLPYFFWEPSSEDSIKYVLDMFGSESCNKTAMHKGFDNIKITSNLEPEMFEVR